MEGKRNTHYKVLLFLNAIYSFAIWTNGDSHKGWASPNVANHTLTLCVSGGKQFSPGLSQHSVSFDSPIRNGHLFALMQGEIKLMWLELCFANIPCKDKRHWRISSSTHVCLV